MMKICGIIMLFVAELIIDCKLVFKPYERNQNLSKSELSKKYTGL